MIGDAKLKIPIPREDGVYYYYVVVSDSFGSSSKKTIVLKVKERQVQIQDFSEFPDWAPDAIIYEIFVKQFTPEGTLKGVIEKIPYLKSLGINCIWLMPIFESPTENGYGVTDFYRIAPQYGTVDDFKELIEKSHQAGIRIMLDFIANHTSDQHRYFVSAFKNPFSVFRDFYKWNSPDEANPFYQYDFFNDWDRLPNLNFDNPQVRQFILENAAYWANFGVDGYRCDVAWGVPHDFWKLFRRHLKNINPNFLTLNETLPRSPLYHDDEFDMSYDTDFYGNLLDVMNDRKPLSAIEYGLQKAHTNYPLNALSLRYLENHDMERFIDQFGFNKTKLAATLMFTIPGTPMILYGQEVGMRDRLPSMDWSRIGDKLYQFYRKLITLRRNFNCFSRGFTEKIFSNAEESVYAFLRYDEKNRFLVILNLADEPIECKLLINDLTEIRNNNIFLEEQLTGSKKQLKISDSNKIELLLNAETSYIYKWL